MIAETEDLIEHIVRRHCQVVMAFNAGTLPPEGMTAEECLPYLECHMKLTKRPSVLAGFMTAGEKRLNPLTPTVAR